LKSGLASRGFPSFPLSSSPLSLPPTPFPSLLSPPLRSRPHLLWLGVSGSGSGRSPAAERYLVNFRQKISPLVAKNSTKFFVAEKVVRPYVRTSDYGLVKYPEQREPGSGGFPPTLTPADDVPVAHQQRWSTARFVLLTWHDVYIVLSDGQQWCIVKSSIKPTWTPCSSSYGGLVSLGPCLSNSSARWPYICLITADAVRLVWTLFSHYDSGLVHVSPCLSHSGTRCVLLLRI